MDYTPLRQYLGNASSIAQASRDESARHATEQARISALYPGVQEALDMPDGDPRPEYDVIFKLAKQDALDKVLDIKDPYIEAVRANEALYNTNMSAIAKPHDERTDAEIARALNLPAGLTITSPYPYPALAAVLDQRILEAIFNASDSIRSKWVPFMDRISSLYSLAVKDQLIRQEDLDAIYVNVNASQAEAWYGAGFVITEEMVGEARNG